jgi:hypothetical protein
MPAGTRPGPGPAPPAARHPAKPRGRGPGPTAARTRRTHANLKGAVLRTPSRPRTLRPHTHVHLSAVRVSLAGRPCTQARAYRPLMIPASRARAESRRRGAGEGGDRRGCEGGLHDPRPRPSPLGGRRLQVSLGAPLRGGRLFWRWEAVAPCDRSCGNAEWHVR